MVASGRGGWDVPMSSYEWQFQQMQRRPRHPRVRRRLAQARRPRCGCSARSARCGRGSAPPRSCPAIAIDAPTTIAWEHENGVRGVWDITLAPDLYLRSDYYTNDERWEVTGRSGYARVNRCTGRGIQQPSLEVYADGEMRGVPRRSTTTGRSSFRDSGPALAALVAHRRGPAVVERRGGRRRAAVRARRVREQRGRAASACIRERWSRCRRGASTGTANRARCSSSTRSPRPPRPTSKGSACT